MRLELFKLDIVSVEASMRLLGVTYLIDFIVDLRLQRCNVSIRVLDLDVRLRRWNVLTHVQVEFHEEFSVTVLREAANEVVGFGELTVVPVAPTRGPLVVATLLLPCFG